MTLGGRNSNAEVRSIMQRILRLKGEQDRISEDIREIYKEAKFRGFNKTSLGQAVATIRKRQKDEEFDTKAAETKLYLDAYYGSGTEDAPHAHEPDRAARRRQRMSESMDDAKALSAEAAALGLINPEAHAETVRIADAVAEKYGNGPIPPHDAKTGELVEAAETEPDQTSMSTAGANGAGNTGVTAGRDPQPNSAPKPMGALSEVALPTTGDDTGLSGSGRAPGTGSAGGEGSTPSGAPITHGLTAEQLAERDALADQYEAKIMADIEARKVGP